MSATKKIMIERETFVKDGKSYFSYYIEGNVRGRDVKVKLVASDPGGYAVLDIVFDTAMEAELVLIPWEMKDEKSGKVTKGNSYAARTQDEDGVVYECQVKPYRTSDKNLLNMLLS